MRKAVLHEVEISLQLLRIVRQMSSNSIKKKTNFHNFSYTLNELLMDSISFRNCAVFLMKYGIIYHMHTSLASKLNGTEKNEYRNSYRIFAAAVATRIFRSYNVTLTNVLIIIIINI